MRLKNIKIYNNEKKHEETGNRTREIPVQKNSAKKRSPESLAKMA